MPKLDVTLTAEEIAGMLLRYIKTLAEKQVGNKVAECVITIPPNWDQKQKNSLLAAAKISKLNVLGELLLH